MSQPWTNDAAEQAKAFVSSIAPLLPTYVSMIASALLPIYAGAHASLHRPVSAAKPKRRADDDGDTRSKTHSEEETRNMEGLSMSDVVLFPLLAGGLLAGLYYLIMYLDDPAVLNSIINGYMSIFGVWGLSEFLNDGMTTAFSYVFPNRYWHKGRAWIVNESRRIVLPQKMGARDQHPGTRETPLPGALSRLPIPASLLWSTRDLFSKPAFICDVQIGKTSSSIRPNIVRLLTIQTAIVIAIYYNVFGRPWWMTNLLGFSFTYTAFQLMSPTSFVIGTALLAGLFFYDIYMVFYTPMMITVAKKLDIPAKLVFPKTDSETGETGYSMLGLGDIVVPGIMIALALRFDLFMFYLKRQIRARPSPGPARADSLGSSNTDAVAAGAQYRKERYVRATGTWGDRFWLGSVASKLVGGVFPKTYFHASIFGYVIGLVVTMLIMHIFDHGQPALLYLVPSVLSAIWGTAAWKGEIHIVWKYTEDTDQARKSHLDSAVILSKSQNEDFEHNSSVESSDDGLDHHESGSQVQERPHQSLDSPNSRTSNWSDSQKALVDSTASRSSGATTTTDDTADANETGHGNGAPSHAPQESPVDLSQSKYQNASEQRRIFRLTISLPKRSTAKERHQHNILTGADTKRFDASYIPSKGPMQTGSSEPAGKRRKLA